MPKIVYNACYGGFGLSEAAVMRYAELKDLTLYPQKQSLWTTYWTKPPGERPELQEGRWSEMTQEERAASNAEHRTARFEPDNIPRNDPILAQVVEELGDAASGRFAKLKIEKLAEGTLYRIDEYDGFETVETADSVEWKVA